MFLAITKEWNTRRQATTEDEVAAAYFDANTLKVPPQTT
jgi:hypothetical protein